MCPGLTSTIHFFREIVDDFWVETNSKNFSKVLRIIKLCCEPVDDKGKFKTAYQSPLRFGMVSFSQRSFYSTPCLKNSKSCKVLHVIGNFLNNFRWFTLCFLCRKFVCCSDVFQFFSKDSIKMSGVLLFCSQLWRTTIYLRLASLWMQPNYFYQWQLPQPFCRWLQMQQYKLNLGVPMPIEMPANKNFTVKPSRKLQHCPKKMHPSYASLGNARKQLRNTIFGQNKTFLEFCSVFNGVRLKLVGSVL